MKTTYDKNVDAAYIKLKDNSPVSSTESFTEIFTESFESKEGVTVALDYSGRNIIGIEILGVKKIIKNETNT